MASNGPEAESLDVLVLQSSCDIGTLISLCEQHDLDHEQLAERRGLDGDAFTLVLATSATAAALRAVEGVIRALLESRHPIKLSVGRDRWTVTGVGPDDLPAVVEAIKATRGTPDAANEEPESPTA